MSEPTIDRATLEVGFRVGEYLVEPQLQRISKADAAMRVEPKVMETLVCMAEHPRQTVTKQQFSEAVWRGTIVTDDAILRCISELRKIFEDDHTEPRYIETIRKKGYRLIAPISMAPPPVPPLTASPPLREPPAAVETPPEPRPASQSRSLWIGATVFLIVLVGVLAALQRITDQRIPTPLKIVPLTSYPGPENDPNLSPDGSRVAFVWDQGDGGNFDIYIKQIGVETPLRLTSDAADDSSPAWSPDGQELAFVHSENGTYSLYLVPTAGGSARKIFDLGERAVRNVTWSPDGTTLAFSAEQTPHAPFALSLLALNTFAEQRLTQPPDDYGGDLELAFSPEGRMIAFSRSAVEKVDDIYVVPRAGGEIKRLTFDRAEITGLDWTTDGRHIVYSSDREGSPALWRIPASGGTPPVWVPTTSEGSGVHQPSIARRGGRLAFVQRLQETNIWEHPLRPAGEAAEPPRQHTASTRWDSNPAISPDGQRVAFASNRSGNYEIWTCDRDGTNPVLLTHIDGPFTNTPRWSPDGRHIAFVTRNEDGTDIYVVSALGGLPLPLTTAASNDQAPSWSRDGQWVYFASNRSGRWEIWKIPADGGVPARVTQQGGFAALEAPDGQTLYFVKRDASGIWQMPTDGSPERLVLPDLQPYDWGNWDVREAGLYFLRRDAAGPVLAFYRFATDTVESLVTLERVPKHPGLAIAPDETHLLFTRIDRIDADILLVEEYE